MPSGIAITRDELSVEELRREAFRSGGGRVACRILAIAAVLEGTSRTDAASSCGMDRQTLRDWVHRYNADGLAGLRDAPRSGRPPALSADQLKALKELVVAGPDVERDGVVRWRCVDLRSQIKTRFDVDVHERTVGKLLHRIGMSHVQPRPFHPQKDAAAQEAFKKLCGAGRGCSAP